MKDEMLQFWDGMAICQPSASWDSDVWYVLMLFGSVHWGNPAVSETSPPDGVFEMNGKHL